MNEAHEKIMSKFEKVMDVLAAATESLGRVVDEMRLLLDDEDDEDVQ